MSEVVELEFYAELLDFIVQTLSLCAKLPVY